ncbi:MAG TPA: Ig-like domain-containing protein, partial [Gemmataceae bacterium]|nr:Ig-like domain-containing protein [Gemmataceae bacterium]
MRLALSYTPSQIAHGYGYDDIYFPTSGGGLVKGDGSGQTIAIVVAYQQPYLVADLHAFDQLYGLPDPQLTIVNGTGSTDPASLPALATGNWGIEASLDVEWAHALAPGANILVVEAGSATTFQLYQAVQTARNAGTGSLANLPNVSVVSMSWGGVDTPGDTLSTIFSTPTGKTGVAFVAATGDTGGAGEYPAADPYVLGVGGTSLTLDASGNYVSESAWAGSNGGFGPNPAPSYQQGIQPSGSTNSGNVRMTPDVSFDADLGTGVYIYDSYDAPSAPLFVEGGTSAGTPCWAALVAIADQGRALAGAGPLAGNNLLADLYAIYGNGNYQYAFHDVTSGSNSSYSAGPGYDLVTGLGSPRAEVVAALLAGFSLTPTPAGPSGSTTSTTPTFQWSSIPGATGYSLTLVDTTNGQTILSNLSLAGTTYTPTTPLTNGHNYQWQVQAFDNNGYLGPNTNTQSFSVAIGGSINHAPTGTSNTITTLEDTAYTFGVADFGFSDPNDTPANSLLAVKITTLPLAGTLTDNGVAVTVGQFIAVADITAGKLKFTPAANANGIGYASFTFQVQDNGGTANGGADTDPSPKTITVNVTAVNDAPTGTSNTVTTLEGTAYTFGVADFGFSDPNDTPANSLLAVKITTLPLAGTLTDNGVA